ncbi:uncharacterized protein LOC141587434 [Silene latifolia]|uniref:uncharacterized protein LOC141587434 n=1 Tax=Silene latifolia TaxID=37657 RepID=UPI003D77EA69
MIRRRRSEFPDDDAFDEHLRQLNAQGSIRRPLIYDREYRHRRALGFYENFNEVDDGTDVSTWPARRMACGVSPSVVALSCTPDEGGKQIRSSGIILKHRIIVEHPDEDEDLDEYEDQYGKKVKVKVFENILSSSYIIGGRSALGLNVDVFLPSGKKVVGSVLYVDLQHNVVLISVAPLDDVRSVSLSTEFVELGDGVLSLGRHPVDGLMVSRGQIRTRNDDLDSDDLMSSTCTISERGIGGPLVLRSSGAVVGMNVYVNKKSSSFIPSILLSHYLDNLLTNGEILRPWLGFKTRNLNEKKLVDLEAVYRKFPSTNGIFVTDVAKGSPADRAGICVDDIITLCSGICPSSSVELADLLLKLGKASLGKISTDERKRKRKHRSIKVAIQRPATSTMFRRKIKFEYFASPVVNSWPVVVPLDISVGKVVHDFSSAVARFRPTENLQLGKSGEQSKVFGLDSSWLKIVKKKKKVLIKVYKTGRKSGPDSNSRPIDNPETC